MRKLVLFIIFSVFIGIIQAQLYNCRLYNNRSLTTSGLFSPNPAHITKALVDICGLDRVGKWIADSPYITFVVKFDGHGRILGLRFHKAVDSILKESITKFAPLSLITSTLRSNNAIFSNEFDSDIFYQMKYEDLSKNAPFYFDKNVKKDTSSTYASLVVIYEFMIFSKIDAKYSNGDTTHTPQEYVEDYLALSSPTFSRIQMAVNDIDVLKSGEVPPKATYRYAYYDTTFLNAFDGLTMFLPTLKTRETPLSQGLFYAYAPIDSSIHLDNYMDDGYDRFRECNLGLKADSVIYNSLDTQEKLLFRADLLIQLAKRYIERYHSYDYFVLICAERVLEEVPNYPDALELRNKVLAREKQSHGRSNQ